MTVQGGPKGAICCLDSALHCSTIPRAYAVDSKALKLAAGGTSEPPPCEQVVHQGDAWYCEHDGKTYESRERRYIMRVKAADASGECFLHLFNDQVRAPFRVHRLQHDFRWDERWAQPSIHILSPREASHLHVFCDRGRLSLSKQSEVTVRRHWRAAIVPDGKLRCAKSHQNLRVTDLFWACGALKPPNPK